jgi:hypothetical protein
VFAEKSNGRDAQNRADFQRWVKYTRVLPETTRREALQVIDLALPVGDGNFSVGWNALETKDAWKALKATTRLKYLSSFRTAVRSWSPSALDEDGRQGSGWTALRFVDPFTHPITQGYVERAEPRAMTRLESGQLLYALGAPYLVSPLRGDVQRPVGAQLAEDIGEYVEGQVLGMLGANVGQSGAGGVRPRPWTTEEVLDSQEAGNCLAFLLTWWLGLRFAVEVKTLTTKSFRMVETRRGERLHLRVRSAKAKKAQQTEYRLVPIPAWLEDFLTPWMREGDEPLLGTTWSERKYRDTWRTTRAKFTGPALERLVPYSARHTAISRMIGQGVSAPLVAKMVGHKNPARIMDYLDPTATDEDYFA